MERLSATKRLAVIRDYLSGLSYDEIAAKNSISKGTVHNVVGDLKEGRIPEAANFGEQIELLREISVALRRSNLTPGQCAIGLAVLARINECGLDPADIDRWPLILKSAGSEAGAREFVDLVYSIQGVQKRTGLNLQELDNKVHDLEKKTADLEPVSKRCKEYEKQMAELTEQRNALAREVAGLQEKYKLLNPRVKDLEKREQALLSHTEEMKDRAEKAEASFAALDKERRELLEAGLSIEALAEFNKEVRSIAKRRNITPEELRHRLLQELEQLDQAIGLEVLVQSRKSGLEEVEQAIARAIQDRERLKAVVSSLKQGKASLEEDVKESREKVSRETSGVILVAMNSANQFSAEVQQELKMELEGIRRLRDETLAVGKEIGRLEQIFAFNQWLTDLLGLIRGENTPGKQVKVIMLPLFRGFVAWLKLNIAANQGFLSLLHHAENLVEKLEQWKV